MKTMKAVVTTGNGDFDKLEYKDVPVPAIGKGEVLIRVLAAGINNTEINTRLGWYSSGITLSTGELATQPESSTPEGNDGGWNKNTPFPLIQGTDCCGIVETSGSGVSDRLSGRRVLIRPCIRERGFRSLQCVWMGSDFDGAFAQFVKVNADEVFPIECDWTDQELATIPCAYGTAENMLHRAGVTARDTVLVTGASGGVGSAALQLAKRRGAKVIGVAGADKHDRLQPLGVDQLFPRNADLISELGESAVDIVVDNVAGTRFPTMLKLLRQGGRLVTSGAIAGPLVALDLRDLYLKDIQLIGTTAWAEPVFPNLIRYIEQREIRPLLAGTYPLQEIVRAQQHFQKKRHVGKIVLSPPS